MPDSSGGELLLRVPGARYASTVPALDGFASRRPEAGRSLLAKLAREAVAGFRGAGRTMTAAMAPGAAVGMLDPSGGDFFYWDLACLAGHRFHWAFTRPLADMPLAEVFNAPTSVRPGQLKRLLAAVAG